MSNFRKAGKYYEWHFQNLIPNSKKPKATNNPDDNEKQVNININMSTLVYMLAVLYWCRFTETSTDRVITSIVILFMLDIVINVVKQIMEIKGEK